MFIAMTYAKQARRGSRQIVYRYENLGEKKNFTLIRSLETKLCRSANNVYDITVEIYRCRGIRLMLETDYLLFYTRL